MFPPPRELPPNDVMLRRRRAGQCIYGEHLSSTTICSECAAKRRKEVEDAIAAYIRRFMERNRQRATAAIKTRICVECKGPLPADNKIRGVKAGEFHESPRCPVCRKASHERLKQRMAARKLIPKS